jgi:hypothetical protein
MIPVETIQGMVGGEVIKENGGSWKHEIFYKL